MKILFITLSNIGDCVLTLPVLDVLIDKYPDAEFSVVTSLRAKEVFEANSFVKKIIIYDKKNPLKEKIEFIRQLCRENYDLVLDLRHTILPFILKAKRLNRLFSPPKNILHMKDRHLLKISSGGGYAFGGKRHFFMNAKNEYASSKDYIVVAPGAKSHLKRWSRDGFAQVCDRVIQENGLSIILVGDSDDKAIVDEIISKMVNPAINLAGKTSLAELAVLLKGAKLVISTDSACMHLASYLNRPITAIFGPTSDKKYGPWSENNGIVKKEVFCRPCENAQCRFGTLDCMKLIKVEDVLRQVNNILGHKIQVIGHRTERNFKRILIVRTDRIGDVVLSTPVIKALKDNFANVYLAMMISPATQELVRGNPYLDEVIVYDKEQEHRGVIRSLQFALSLRKKKFDIAVILHSTNRVNLLAYLAGIKERVGYSRRLGFLLTDNIPYVKYRGEKHEVEYNLDLLRCLGIEVNDASLFIPKDNQAEAWAKEIFKSYGIDEIKEKIIVLHPSASCASRMWPIERFREVAEALIKKYDVRIIIVSGANDIALTEKLAGLIREPVINLGGKTTLMQLASILRRSTLMISNDSGPVHIAVGCGLPVVVLFGRAQPGLSPLRWGPRGTNDIVLHKKADCVVCLAHDCKNNFACLKSIEASDVLSAVDGIIKVC